MSGLVVESITKQWRRDAPPVLKGVSLQVAEGEVVYLLGPNGSGKTTLLRMVAGDVVPDQGQVSLDGRQLLGVQPVKLATLVAHVAQDRETCTSGDQSVLEHLLLAEDFSGAAVSWFLPKWRSRRLIMNRLRELDVPLVERLDSLASTLSGGERQSLSLLMSSMRRPRVLLLDEPTRELDAQARVEVDRLLQRLMSEYRPATIVVTHEYEEALRRADRIVFLRAGEIVGEMTPSSASWTLGGIKEALWGPP